MFSAMNLGLLVFGITGMPICTCHFSETCAPDLPCALPILVTIGPEISASWSAGEQGPQSGEKPS